MFFSTQKHYVQMRAVLITPPWWLTSRNRVLVFLLCTTTSRSRPRLSITAHSFSLCRSGLTRLFVFAPHSSKSLSRHAETHYYNNTLKRGTNILVSAVTVCHSEAHKQAENSCVTAARSSRIGLTRDSLSQQDMQTNTSCHLCLLAATMLRTRLCLTRDPFFQ